MTFSSQLQPRASWLVAASSAVSIGARPFIAPITRLLAYQKFTDTGSFTLLPNIGHERLRILPRRRQA